MAKRSSVNADAKSKARSQWQTLKTLSYYIWPKGRADLKTRVLLALLSLALAKVVNVYVPFLYKGAVDALTLPSASLNNATAALPLGIIIAYGLARILHQFFGEVRDFIFVKVSQHAQRMIALHTFQHLHRLSLSFHLQRQTGGLSRVIERGTHGLQFLLGFILFNIIPTLLEIIMVTVVLFYTFDIRFAAVTFISIAGYIAYTLAVTEWRMKYRRQMNATDAEANSKAIDSLLNYETVKYFGNERREYERFDQALASYEAAAIKSQNSLSVLNVGQGVIIGLGLIIIMAMAGNGVVSGVLTVGDFVLVNTFMIQLYLPLNFLGFVYREIKRSLIDMDKMFELLEINAEVEDMPNAKCLAVKQGQVEFDNVSFGYDKKRHILQHISFKIEPGKTLAIVGPSGSGKSTISKLLFRFYDVTAGNIRIDGQDIRRVSQQSLRAAIGVVPQDTVLFNDSIMYNIQYGRPDAVSAEIHQAAKLASIHDFVVKLPDGYKTAVGERGLKLSGGEKQRVAIARTILKDPDILLFDEATSALDSHTEKEIQSSLTAISENKTTLIIAHRLSTIVNADQILVLKEGKIVERGTHAQLLQQNSEYAAMWALQQKHQDSPKRV